MACKRNTILVAIAYDFDGTLSPENMQNYGFIPDLGIKIKDFWDQVKSNAKKHEMDEILAYMDLMLSEAKKKEKQIRKQDFIKSGKKIKLFPGVEDWFGHIDAHASDLDITVEHYIISSGLREMIKGTSIGNKFKYIYASGFKYDHHDVAVWPALAVNYTTKLQYLFRINKGKLKPYDNEEINKVIAKDKRRIPFENMIYIGDGETDVPAMKMVKYQKGHAIAVYKKGKKGIRELKNELLVEDRADYAFPADYSNNSKLCIAVKDIISKIAIEHRLRKYQKDSRK